MALSFTVILLELHDDALAAVDKEASEALLHALHVRIVRFVFAVSVGCWQLRDLAIQIHKYPICIMA